MTNFGEKLVARNFKKRFIAIAIAAAVMLVLSAASVAVLCHTQISEAVTLEKTLETQEKLQSEAQRGDEEGGHDSEREDPELFQIGMPLPVVSIVILIVVAALDSVLMLFYWASVVEWLYKAAVKNWLNRALWPILGAFFNLLAVFALLIIINEPKRGTT